MQFSYELFGDILDRLLEAGYVFERFDRALDPNNSKKIVYLRHDVDISPRSALVMGEITAAKGAVGNHFFQLNAETYNVFSDHTLGIIKELRGMGHCVGLHIDQNLNGDEEAPIAQTIAWFSECCTPIDKAISFHRPTERVLGHEYKSFINAYGSSVFQPDSYAADSRRSLDFLAKVDSWILEGPAQVQLLLHPEWWFPHADAHDVWADLRARREWELAQYVTHNFKKVFEGVVAASVDDRFGV